MFEKYCFLFFILIPWAELALWLLARPTDIATMRGGGAVGNWGRKHH